MPLLSSVFSFCGTPPCLPLLVPQSNNSWCIIIINFYGASIIKHLISEAQQNIIIKHNREQGRPQVIIITRDNRRCMVEMQFGINIFFFFRKIAVALDVFKVMGSSFQILGAVTEKKRLPKLSLVLGTIHFY